MKDAQTFTASAEARCDAGFAEQIDEWMLDEEISAKRAARLREHLPSCPSCQQRYNKVMLALRLLHGGPEAIGEPSAVELASVKARLLERARLAPEPPLRHGLLKWIGGLVAVGAALAIVIPLSMKTNAPPPADPTPAFQARGQAPRQGGEVGLRLFCLRRDASSTVVEIAGKRQIDCPLSATLTFAYTNRSKLTQLALVGVTADYALRWYLPRSPAGKSQRIKTNVVDEPLSRSVKLSVNHQGGGLRVFAVFSAKPLSARRLRQAVGTLKRRRHGVEKAELLPIDDTEQRSLWLRLQAPATKAKPKR